MSARVGRLAATGLLALAAYAQTAADHATEQKLPLRYVATQVGINEMTNLLRSLVEIRDVSYDSAAQALAIRATNDRIAFAQWLVSQLDKPPDWPAPAPQSPAVYEFHPLAGDDAPNTAVRVFYMARTAQPAELQDLMLVMRTGAGIMRVLIFTADNAIVVRGAPEQIAMAEWLVQQLGQPSPSRKPAAFEYDSPDGGPNALASAVRVLYLNPSATPQDIQEMLWVLRTGAGIQRVFPINAQQAVVFRGEPESVKLGEWFVEKLDRPAEPGRKPESYEHHSPYSGEALDSAVRVYYLANIASPEAIRDLVQQIRVGAQVKRVIYCSAPRALAFRGTVEKVALAEKLIAGADKPAQ